MLPIGYILADTYRITKLIGRGGMAHVYEVCHVRLPARSAVKVITGGISTDSKFKQRFRQEAEILAQLHHPHVVKVLDWNLTKEGQPYLVMELLEGEDLAQRIRRTGAMSLAEALPIFLQISDALQAAHDRGIIHRDLKPANVFLLNNGAFPNYVKVLDFGIAKAIDARSAVRTKNAELLGTPAYMAPEQVRGTPNAASVRSDQFALALVLYEMLAGRSAFYVAEEDLLQTLTRVLMEEPEPLPYPQIEPALRRALSKSPHDRFPAIRDFVVATGALELSVIRPLLSYTRQLPSVPIEISPSTISPAEADAPAVSGAPSSDSGAECTGSREVPCALEPPAIPAPTSGSQLRAPGAAAALPQTSSRPSIKGQKITSGGRTHWPRTLTFGLVAGSLALASAPVILRWPRIHFSLFARAPSASRTQLAAPAAPLAATRVEPPAAPPHHAAVLCAPSEHPATEIVGLATSASWAAARSESSQSSGSKPADSDSVLGTRIAPVAPEDLRTPTLPSPQPSPRVTWRRTNRRVLATKVTGTPAGFTVQGTTAEVLTDAQREFILKCVRPLSAAAQSRLAAQPAELSRAGRRLVVTTEQLEPEDRDQLERCLSAMEDEMGVPKHATVSVTKGEPEKGKSGQ